MLARLAIAPDGPELDKLLRHGGITDTRKDSVFVVGEPVGGVLVYRPAALVHELEVRGNRRQAEALTNHAIGVALTLGLRSAIFLVREGNDSMKRFVESLGAVKQNDPGDTVYLLTP